MKLTMYTNYSQGLFTVVCTLCPVFLCFVQLTKRGANCSNADDSKQKIVDKNIRNYKSRFANCRRHVTGFSHLPVQFKGLGTKVSFAMTYLTVWNRTLICRNLYRGNRFVAHQFLRTPMHSNDYVVRLFIGSILEFNLSVRVFLSYQHHSHKRLQHNT